MVAVVGRSYELEVVADFLESVGSGASALLVEGDVGIGRSTLWLAALEQAADHGFHTLAAAASATESAMEYGTVADLLAEVDPEVFAGLPAVQFAAIERVLLRGTRCASSADRHVIPVALLAVIERLSRTAPVLLAVDDVQWLDECSRVVIAYAARRLRKRAGILATERPRIGRASATSWLELRVPDAVRRLPVGPLAMGELHDLLSARLGRRFSRPTMRRIAEISAGNPYYALELARAIDEGSSVDAPELPQTLVDLVHGRMGGLSLDTRRTLLAAACIADATVEALARATGTSVERTVELLDDAERRGLVTIDGNRVRYCHPLMASGVYNTNSPADRRQMHSVLADIVTHPELKVRHQALAASSQDPDLMRAIDTAADAARARGAPADAAELLDLAIKLGGDTPLRLIRSAENHLRSGDSVRVREMLPPVLAELPPGIDRAVTLNILAGAHVLHNGLADAADLLRRAIDDARGNPAVMVQTLLALAFTRSMAGEYDEAQRVANRAVCHAEKVGVPALLSQALANQVTINALCGNGIDEAALDRALDLEDPGLDVSIMFHATAAKAQVLAWTGRLDEARVELRELRRRCSQHGADSDLFYVAVHTALVEIWRGRFDDAAQVADEAVQLAEQVGGEHAVAIARSMRAAAAAYAGRESAARADIAAALSAVAHGDTPQMAHWPMAALGFLEVSLGNYDEAAEALKQRCDEFSNMPGTEIVSANFIPDAVEAFIGLGRNAEAEPLIKALEHSGRLLDRRWMLAIGARCRAMMQAADGEVELAERTAHEALTLHEELPMPFETARTQLLLGQLQRRRRLKLAAAETISEALRAFEDMGSALWAERARAELNRTNVSPTRGSDLTPSELRVAELAGAGLTNADVAAHLSLSAKTVEANLTRIYRKLDIHSRTALVRLMQASGQ